MEKYIIAIVGGQGSGKSTLAYSLLEKYPNLIEVVHFDDYQKEEHEIPVHMGVKDWDCPQAIDFNKLNDNLNTLLSGKRIPAMTKSRYYNPDYEKNGRVPHILQPRKILIIEGYIPLWDERIQKLTNYTIYLSLPFDIMLKRRDKDVETDFLVYVNKILKNAQTRYVEPQKKNADLIIDVSNTGTIETRNKVIEFLKTMNVLEF